MILLFIVAMILRNNLEFLIEEKKWFKLRTIQTNILEKADSVLIFSH